MVNQKKAVKKAAAFLIFSTLTVASSCYLLAAVNSIPFSTNQSKNDDSLRNIKVSDNSGTTTPQNDNKETAPYPGDGKDTGRWRKSA